ncbi:rod shape-determining protein MreC [Geothermobacter ehrlichii]|uniref:Cell shape-determining protein MreC n=1 Tax=Geothermobacter ehrlichii TaxID=213224 RepID=A0A5D3WJD9_9BACT|nr:rod shape-determining protein MreC [Geothermobacter ehrlichii]TYO98677.1 rod shape-determining protein MreC [Geothermobacter ehrlichii]
MLDFFRKYRIHLLAGSLLLASLLFYSYQLRHRQNLSLFHRGLLQLTAPFQRMIDVSVETVAETWNRYLWLVDTAEQNERLRRENRRLRSALADLAEVRLANERLRRLLDLRQEVTRPVLPAQVIGEDASSWFRTVVIDKGASDGVREGLPVVVPEGIVGRTFQVAPHASRVLLVTDASSAVAVLVQPTRSRAICRGRAQRLVLDFALRNDQISVGDPVVTSGMGGIFPKGLMVGMVSEISRGDYGLFQGVAVEPSVDFSRLEEVLVLLEPPK